MSALAVAPSPVVRTPFVPNLRLHKASGQLIAEFDGKAVYFGRETEPAWSAFLPRLAAWRASTGVQAAVSVWEAADRLSERVAADNGHDSKVPTFAHLKPFCMAHGIRLVDSITVDDIEGYKSKLQADEYAPKSVNHFIAAVKRLIRYSAFRGWRTPMELSFVAKVKMPTPPPKHVPIAVVGDWLEKAERRHPQLALWLKVQMALAARPSEIIRLARKAYTVLEPGVLHMNVGKTNKTVKHPRCLVVQPEVMKLVEAMEPRWKSQSSLAQACQGAFDSGCHRLRHTAAYVIHRLPGERASRDDTDILLGHYPGYVSLVYNPIDWEPVKALQARYFGYLQSVLPKVYPLC